jgi:hypothetical protein
MIALLSMIGVTSCESGCTWVFLGAPPSNVAICSASVCENAVQFVEGSTSYSSTAPSRTIDMKNTVVSTTSVVSSELQSSAAQLVLSSSTTTIGTVPTVLTTANDVNQCINWHM